MTSSHTKSASPQWAIFRQFAQHREVLLTNNVWCTEEICVKHPDIRKPRLFDKKATAERFITRVMTDRTLYTARWKQDALTDDEQTSEKQA